MAIVFLNWLDQNYLLRIEQGDPRYEYSKIEVVRRDGGDFDDPYLAIMKHRLETSVFPTSIYTLYFETDEFRRFVRIYVDYAVKHKGKDQAVTYRAIVPKDEIETRIRSTR
jgi:hypothetical protein